MINNIIPIRYINGTGGNFIAKFLQYAFDNKPIPNFFSYHGNAHAIPSNIIHLENLNTEANKQKILEISKKLYNETIIFAAVHSYKEFEENFFLKYINITYRLSSAINLSKVHHYKFVVDENVSKELIESVFERNIISYYLKRNKFHQHIYKKNICNLDWESEILGNPELLINKLSKFTNIDRNNFDLETLTIWQNKTKLLFN